MNSWLGTLKLTEHVAQIGEIKERETQNFGWKLKGKRYGISGG